MLSTAFNFFLKFLAFKLHALQLSVCSRIVELFFPAIYLPNLLSRDMKLFVLHGFGGGHGRIS